MSRLDLLPPLRAKITPLPPRKAKRRSARRSISKTSLFWVAFALVAAAGLGYLAWHEAGDPRFYATISRVSGNAHTSSDDIVRAAAIGPAQNAWLINRKQVTRRIAQLPWVASATMQVSWPNRVSISVVERQPIAQLILPSGNQGEEPGRNLAVIDSTQRILELMPQDAVANDLPLIDIAPAPTVEAPGEDLKSASLAEAIAALNRLRMLGLQIFQVSVARSTGVSAIADRHVRVIFGDPQDLEKKTAVFKAIVAKISQPERVAYVDVRSVRAPTVLYR